MLSLGLSNIGRRAAVVAGAVAIVSAVACSDDTTAPQPAAAKETSGPQAMILPARSLVTVRIKKVNGALLPEKGAVMFYAAGDSGVVWDNSAADKDMTVGIITVALPWSATFKACLYTDTQNYAIEALQPHCNSATGNVSAVDLGSLVMHHFPIVVFIMQDMSFNQISGGSLTVTAPLNDGFSEIATDEGQNDLLVGTPGRIGVQGNRPGTYTWCEKVAPNGYLLTSPTCGTVNLAWDTGIGVEIKHQMKLVIRQF
jgi:hypothetical protein